MVNPKNDKINQHCLLGILNSKILQAFWIDKYSDQRSTFPKIKGTYLKKLPIPKSLLGWDGKKACLYTDLYNNVKRGIILRGKATHATPHEQDFLKRDCDALDKAIDAIVYEVYELSSKEITIIEEVISKQQKLKKISKEVA